jgi:hypothetical protein
MARHAPELVAGMDRNTHAGECFSTLREGDCAGDGLDDVGTAVTVQDFARSTQKVCEGLAVLAVAYGAISGLAGVDAAFEGSATALQGVVHGWDCKPRMDLSRTTRDTPIAGYSSNASSGPSRLSLRILRSSAL